MGLLIKRSDGMMVFDASSDKAANKGFSSISEENHSVRVGMRMNLPAGDCLLGAHFYKPGQGFYFYDDELREFHVVGPQTKGAAFADTGWE